MEYRYTVKGWLTDDVAVGRAYDDHAGAQLRRGGQQPEHDGGRGAVALLDLRRWQPAHDDNGQGELVEDPRGYVIGRAPDGRESWVEDPAAGLGYAIVRDPDGNPIGVDDGVLWRTQAWGNPLVDLPLVTAEDDGFSAESALLVAIEGVQLGRLGGSGLFTAMATDAQGSVVLDGTDLVGVPEAFGADVDAGSALQRHRYAGLESLPGVPFQLARARLMDPTVGRFVGVDPIGLDGGDHRFLYAENQPTGFVDPGGLMSNPTGSEDESNGDWRGWKGVGPFAPLGGCRSLNCVSETGADAPAEPAPSGSDGASTTTTPTTPTSEGAAAETDPAAESLVLFNGSAFWLNDTGYHALLLANVTEIAFGPLAVTAGPESLDPHDAKSEATLAGTLETLNNGAAAPEEGSDSEAAAPGASLTEHEDVTLGDRLAMMKDVVTSRPFEWPGAMKEWGWNFIDQSTTASIVRGDWDELPGRMWRDVWTGPRMGLGIVGSVTVEPIGNTYAVWFSNDRAAVRAAMTENVDNAGLTAATAIGPGILSRVGVAARSGLAARLGGAAGGGRGAGWLSRPWNPCGMNSFTPDTEVLTIEGWRPISSLREGDRVWACDDTTGLNCGWRRVQGVIVGADKPVVEVEVEYADGTHDFLDATAGHPFAVEGMLWVDAADLEPGDALYTPWGLDASVVGVVPGPGRSVVYNLTVARAHTFFVAGEGGDGVWVHNGGESDAAKAGREAHLSYRSALGDGWFYDERLESGRRPDAYRLSPPEVRELKPDDPRAMRRGWKQLAKYAAELEAKYGVKFARSLDTYARRVPCR